MKTACFAALGAMLLLTACGGAPAPGYPAGTGEKSSAVTFTDDLGRTVTVDRPKRVACLIASFADIWHLAGGAEQIVAGHRRHMDLF